MTDKSKLSLVILFLLLAYHAALAQYPQLRQAFIYAEEPAQLDSANLLANMVVQDEVTKGDPQAWYLHGLVNKQFVVYRKWSNDVLKHAFQVIKSTEKSQQLDPTPDNTKINKELLQSLYNAIDKVLNQIADTVQLQQTAQAVLLQEQLMRELRPKAKQDSVAIHYFFHLGEKSNAEVFYNKVLIVQPSNWLANFKIGEIYLQQLQLQAAQIFLERAYQSNARSKKILNSLSRLYNLQGDQLKSQQFKQLAIDIGVD